MISRPTVFILGAGASAPYGFPTGKGLLKAIHEQLVRDRPGQAKGLLTELGHDQDECARLSEAVFHSGATSIDRFLETNPGLSTIAKRAVAALLCPREHDNRVIPPPARDNPPPNPDLYSSLVEMMVTREPIDFLKNNVSFVTFNFDRSLERALFLRLSARYSALSPKDVAGLVRHLPIMHVHGMLGAPTWLDGVGRDYAERITAAEVSRVAEDLAVYADRLPPVLEKNLKETLEAAEHVVFLGFGFLRDNVLKLGLPGSLRSAKTLSATTFQLDRRCESIRDATFKTFNPSMACHQLLCSDLIPRLLFLED
jgi:hypothetical protein